MKISKKIIVTFLGSIVIGVLVIAGFSSIATILFSQSAADEAAQITLNEELLSLDRLARDKTIFVNAYFEEIAAQLNFLKNYAEDLFNGRIPIETRPSYYGETSTESSEPPGMHHDVVNDRWISYYASAWYFPDAQPNASRSDLKEPEYVPLSELSDEVWALVNTSSNLDFAYKSVFDANPLILQIYLGFECNGLFRTYPYKNLDHYPYREGAGYGPKGYDPRLRSWYISGKAADALDFGDPYIFATSGRLGISATITVKWDNGTLLGVFGTNIVVANIESAILGLQVLESGYAFLINNNKTEPITLVHPDIVDPATPIKDLEPLSSSILDKMTSLNSGRDSFRKNGEQWRIAYYPVDVAECSLGIVVPESEILAGANLIRSTTTVALLFQTVLFLLIVGTVGIIMFFGVREISKRIVEPINELVEVTEQIAQGNLHRSLEGRAGGAKEIVVLYDTFRGLITALRFGNEEYYAGNLNRAMTNYDNALELFSTLDNIKGIGICHNNIGNIHNAKGNLKEAQESYQKAIEIGESLLSTSKGEDEKFEHTIALASRNNNLGMLNKSIGHFKEAEEYLKKALEYDKSIDYARGFAVRYGNLGQIYLAENKYDEAKKHIEEAYAIAQSLKSERAIAYALMNLGSYYKSVDNPEKAKEFFSGAIDRAEDLDIRVVRTSLLNLQEIYEHENNSVLVKEVGEKLNKLMLRSLASRELYFVLDYSGSMSGTRIRDARKGILNIFANQVRDIDFVSLITFNVYVTVISEPKMKKEASQEFIRQVESLNRPDYTTAMYDAIGTAFKRIKDRRTHAESWIIVLTDGDDNASKYHGSDSIIKIARQAVNTNLVIIGVGDLKDRDKLKRICKSSAKGQYIEIEAGVSGAITEAFEEVSTMLAEFEVEGFVADY